MTRLDGTFTAQGCPEAVHIPGLLSENRSQIVHGLVCDETGGDGPDKQGRWFGTIKGEADLRQAAPDSFKYLDFRRVEGHFQGDGQTLVLSPVPGSGKDVVQDPFMGRMLIHEHKGVALAQNEIGPVELAEIGQSVGR